MKKRDSEERKSEIHSALEKVINPDSERDRKTRRGRKRDNSRNERERHSER